MRRVPGQPESARNYEGCIPDSPHRRARAPRWARPARLRRSAGSGGRRGTGSGGRAPGRSGRAPGPGRSVERVVLASERHDPDVARPAIRATGRCQPGADHQPVEAEPPPRGQHLDAPGASPVERFDRVRQAVPNRPARPRRAPTGVRRRGSRRSRCAGEWTAPTPTACGSTSRRPSASNSVMPGTPFARARSASAASRGRSARCRPRPASRPPRTAGRCWAQYSLSSATPSRQSLALSEPGG